MLDKTLGGRYQVIRYLGGGGFGQTYLAKDLHLPGKPFCVVKQLKPKVANPLAFQASRRLFEREAEALYCLGSHDQIPRLFAHFEEAQEFYLVQEFIEGTVLNQAFKPGQPMDETAVVALIQDVLTTLAFVQQQQVIHRDIKPSNLIRRCSDGKIVLIDFGVVKQIRLQAAGGGDQTSATIAIGSSGYMPNEQLAGKPRFSSDVYAVGMVGLQALTGLYPVQLREDPRTGEILWRDRAAVTTEFADILDTMVRYDFRQRYQSATEALQALHVMLSPDSADGRVGVTAPIHSLDGHLVWLERGEELFQQQRYPEAVACYEKVLQVTPDDYTLWFKRGIALENFHRYEEAVVSYDKVIDLQPDDYLAWFKRGKALENLQDFDEALACYDRVIELQPDNYWAWHDRGHVLEEQHLFELAVTAYDRAVQIKADFQLAIESRKRVLSQMKQVDRLYHLQHYDEAIASCDQAIQTQPDDALAWLMRGMAMENSQRYEDAVASYDHVVQLQPDDYLAWFKRGAVLEKLQRYEDAVVSYDQVARIQSENCWAWHDRGRALEQIQWYDEAISSYDRALQLQPDMPSATEGRQRCMEQLKQGCVSLSPVTRPQAKPGVPIL